MSNVVFFMLDGLRPDALALVNCPHLQKLRERGASTLQAKSLMPGITLPCHMSLFHSVPPARHGVTTNIFTPMARPLPGLIDHAKANGKRCAMFHSWEPLRNLNQPETLAFSYYRQESHTDVMYDQYAADAAIHYLKSDEPDFAFVYFGSIDLAGHGFGWMSDFYLSQIERVDAILGSVLEVLDEDTFILAQADHGGHERTHGVDIPEDMLIPWVAAGKNIRPAYTIQGEVTLLDTAPTLAHFLGLTPHPEWEGRVIEEIFAS